MILDRLVSVARNCKYPLLLTVLKEAPPPSQAMVFDLTRLFVLTVALANVAGFQTAFSVAYLQPDVFTGPVT